jgi:hypothetical protein
MQNGITYAAGFGFSPGGAYVALLLKLKGPAWLVGKLSSIGGKVEPGESPYVAMCREWGEEVHGPAVGDWQEFCKLSYPAERGGVVFRDTVHFFAGTIPMGWQNIIGAEAEPVYLINPWAAISASDCFTADGIFPVYHNITWLLVMARQKLGGTGIQGIYEIAEDRLR